MQRPPESCVVKARLRPCRCGELFPDDLDALTGPAEGVLEIPAVSGVGCSSGAERALAGHVWRLIDAELHMTSADGCEPRYPTFQHIFKQYAYVHVCMWTFRLMISY